MDLALNNLERLIGHETQTTIQDEESLKNYTPMYIAPKKLLLA